MSWLELLSRRLRGRSVDRGRAVETVKYAPAPAVPGWQFDPTWRPSLARGWSNIYPAMQVGAVYACARLIAGVASGLPVDLFERQADGTRRRATDQRLHRLLHDSPNADQTSLEYVETIVLNLLFAGDHIARKHRSGGNIVAVEPVDPRFVQVRRGARGQRLYRLPGESSEATEDEIFHIRGFGGDALRGMSVISYGAKVVQRSGNVEEAADGVFRNGIRTSGVFEVDKFLSEEQFADFNERVGERFAGVTNVGRPLILEGGTKFNALQMSNDDAQLLQSRGFSVEEVCRLFGVPPFMVGYTEKSTSWGTGIEQQRLAFQTFTLTPWLRRIEQAINKQLIPVTEQGRFYAEFNLEGFLRADSKSRGEFYQRMTAIGAMTVNEVRQRENLPPIEGGDVARVQMQNVPLEAANGEGQQP